MYNNEKIIEKFIIFAADIDNGEIIEENLDELDDLIKTAGAVVVGRLIQKKDSIDNATYLGSGKVLELKELVEESGATGVVCDDELSPMQLKNLEAALDVKVVDRTMVILDIFAGRATTKEGKIQVELAQLKYRASRLIGMHDSLSKLGGGIGTRGPGEKKLELDRRIIRDRIAQLSRELKVIVCQRDVMRKQRMESMIPIVSIVGYTNAGKSTLLNKLTDAGVLEEDKLFATLDPTSRNYKLPNGQEIIITDTVGFIRKLPHHLISAFRSTLEETKYADIIIHVVDTSSPQVDKQIAAVYDTLDELEVGDKCIVTAFNKIDKLDGPVIIKDFRADATVNIAAKFGEGFPELAAALEEAINKCKKYIETTIPYTDANKVNLIHKYGNLLEEDYREDGIFVRAYVDKSFNI